jgi:hypothetical protein
MKNVLHHTPFLSAEQKIRFEQDGFLILRQAISPERISAMQALIDRVSTRLLEELVHEGVMEKSHADLRWDRRLIAAGRHAARWGRSWRRLLNDRAVYDLHHSPSLVAALHDLLGAAVYGHSIFNGRPKLPGQGLTVVPWHQDSGLGVFRREDGHGKDYHRLDTAGPHRRHQRLSGGCLRFLSSRADSSRSGQGRERSPWLPRPARPA